MTSRERWTIYPLLFFALAMAARDKVATPPESSFRSITCQRLVVQNLNGQPLIQIGVSADGNGAIEVLRPSNATATANAPPESLLEISANERGGYFTAFGTEDRPGILVGYRVKEDFGGLMAVNGADELVGAGDTFRGSAWGIHCLAPPPVEKAKEEPVEKTRE